jgi:hypothetical protein
MPLVGRGEVRSDAVGIAANRHGQRRVCPLGEMNLGATGIDLKPRSRARCECEMDRPRSRIIRPEVEHGTHLPADRARAEWGSRSLGRAAGKTAGEGAAGERV